MWAGWTSRWWIDGPMGRRAGGAMSEGAGRPSNRGGRPVGGRGVSGPEGEGVRVGLRAEGGSKGGGLVDLRPEM